MAKKTTTALTITKSSAAAKWPTQPQPGRTGVYLGTSQYGTLQPTYQLSRMFTAGAEQRSLSAAVYKLAAEIEEASFGEGEWVVVPNVHAGTVHLELIQGSEAEAHAGMMVLKKVEAA